MSNEPNNNPSKHGNGKFRNHNFRRRKPARSAIQQEANASSQKPQAERATQELKICAVCGKPIFDLTGAIASREDGEPIHFDCALELLSKEEKLTPDEKLMYIGSGLFGVCAQSAAGKLEIRRKIRWEAAGTIQPWRKPMMSSPSLP
ncbi:hypothetical protein SPIRO4BDMA_40102 [uncultured spirochete]|jgi:hypothetical protein|uniref:Uncharacterized protein n=1 Tax=uncultured spirochete TaxID=156406 RepID=A0A3P3XNP8_9SPIR|nr:hypothetical protein SPIRO4BDMA_40102 [uncultured spirochete]